MGVTAKTSVLTQKIHCKCQLFRNVTELNAVLILNKECPDP